MGNETDCMVGYSAVPVIVDAYFKRFEGFDVKLAYEAVKKSTTRDDYGVNLLKEMEYEMKRDWPKSKIYLFASEALYGLEENGTDMPFYHKDTIMSPEIKTALSKHPAVSKKIKCAIFDWGDRCKFSINHYREFIHYCDEVLETQKDKSIINEIKSMKDSALNQLKESEKPL